VSIRLSTTDISDRIGLLLTVKFITDTLGVPHREQEKKARFWYEEDYLVICEKLSAYALNRITDPMVTIAAAVAPAPSAAMPAPAEEEDLSILG